MMKKCWFDADGNLINIGEWDTMPERVEVQPAQYDEQGNEIAPAVFETVERNPIPEGAYVEEREVVYDDNYGWRLADAPVPVSDKERIEALEAALLEVILGG